MGQKQRKGGKQKGKTDPNSAPSTGLCSLSSTAALEDCPWSSSPSSSDQLTSTWTPASLESLLSWFTRSAAAHDPQAHLDFLSARGKQERALVHSVVEARFPSLLESVSTGVGEDRCVAVWLRGHAPKPAADEAIRIQGARLYKYAREAGLSNYSQDELIERLAAGSLPDELKELWERRSVEQQGVEQLMAAVVADDAAAVQALCAQIPGIANMEHIDSFERPLSCAARLNRAAAARALIEAGSAHLETKDGVGKTPLKIARTFESTEVEAVLLQSGAHDPDAGVFLLDQGVHLLRPPQAELPTDAAPSTAHQRPQHHPPAQASTTVASSTAQQAPQQPPQAQASTTVASSTSEITPSPVQPPIKAPTPPAASASTAHNSGENGKEQSRSLLERLADWPAAADLSSSTALAVAVALAAGCGVALFAVRRSR